MHASLLNVASKATSHVDLHYVCQLPSRADISVFDRSSTGSGLVTRYWVGLPRGARCNARAR